MEHILTLTKKSATYKLIIPVEVENKIRFLCQRVPNVEWSGALFFTYEGSIKDNNLVVTCRDIFVMDIGSAGYTEFDMSPEVISYMCDKPELLDMQIGLVHSHHLMNSFFSGTDTNTLKEEGRDRNHFVSLIVNNAGTYTAAITARVKSVNTVQEVFTYSTFNDEVVSDTREYTKETETIEYYGLDIIKEGTHNDFKEVDKRLEEIRKRKTQTPAKSTIPVVVRKGTEMPSLFGNGIAAQGLTAKESPNVRTALYNSVPIDTDNPISKEDVQHVLLQLITGSIIIREDSKIDINKWVNSMPKLFGERFGVDEYGFESYESWAEIHCEFLLSDKEPDVKGVHEEEAWFSAFALELYRELDALPKNRYIEILKGITEQWIV